MSGTAIVVHTTGAWTTAAAIGAMLAALATAVAAGVTAWMAVETRRVAKATRDQAEATARAADATARDAEATRAEATATTDLVREAQKDRDLLWRPVLSETHAEMTSGADGISAGCW